MWYNVCMYMYIYIYTNKEHTHHSQKSIFSRVDQGVGKPLALGGVPELERQQRATVLRIIYIYIYVHRERDIDR